MRFVRLGRLIPKGSGRHRIREIVMAAGFLLIAVNSGLAAAYEGRLYPGVKVADVNLGGLTRPQAKQLLTKNLNPPALTVAVGERSFTATASDLGVQYDLDATVEQAYANGRQHWAALSGFMDQNLSLPSRYAYGIDRSKLNAFIDQVTEGSGRPAVDAKVVVENGNFKVIADQNGQSVDRVRLAKIVEQTVAQSTSQSISVAPVSSQAEIRADQTGGAIEEAKRITVTPIDLTFNEKHFSPGVKEIAGWLVFEKTIGPDGPQLVPRVDAGKVKNYVQNVANSVNLAPVNRKVDVQNGVSKETRPGVDGFAIDQDAVAKSLIAAASSKQALTLVLVTHPVAFKTEVNNFVSLDYGRYVEISISKQHLWVFQDHQPIFDTAVTTGMAGHDTQLGLFSIYYKTTNTRLVGYQYGYNYNLAVKYWMPFNGGAGMHDAYWRSSFGGADYRWNGSHGCINMPLSGAAWVYNWSSVGTPVWVHL